TRQVPWLARLVFILLLSLGMVAVSFATQIVVPVVLGLLSLFFARRPLTNAAEAVRNAGNTAVDAMQWARRRWLLGGVSEPNSEDDSRSRVRVGEESMPQTRIAEDDDATDAVDPIEASTAADEKSRPAS
ncbi:MAG: hypothetical protein M3O46_11270, partial [Myxococcota bacterium]|nr:hypothetical protein [Myxococcota bacterium]